MEAFFLIATVVRKFADDQLSEWSVPTFLADAIKPGLSAGSFFFWEWEVHGAHLGWDAARVVHLVHHRRPALLVGLAAGTRRSVKLLRVLTPHND